MGCQRIRFSSAASWEIGEQNVNQPPGNFSEGISVEEKEGGCTMAVAQKIESLEKGQLF